MLLSYYFNGIYKEFLRSRSRLPANVAAATGGAILTSLLPILCRPQSKPARRAPTTQESP
jgi:hypothetical protein